jgi:hypothetical protein
VSCKQQRRSENKGTEIRKEKGPRNMKSDRTWYSDTTRGKFGEMEKWARVIFCEDLNFLSRAATDKKQFCVRLLGGDALIAGVHYGGC